MKRMLIFGLAVVALTAVVALAGTKAVGVVMIPTAEVTAGIGKYIQKHPDSSAAYYRLGRAHYLAAALKMGAIGLAPSGEKEPAEVTSILDRFQAGRPTLDVWDIAYPMGYAVDALKIGGLDKLDHDKTGNSWMGGVIDKEMTDQTARDHRRDAIVNLRQAIKLDPKNARAHLVLGCALEDDAKDAGLVAADPKEVDKSRLAPEAARKEAVAEYLTAYNLAIKDEARLEAHPEFGLRSLISYEAGRSYLKFVENTPVPMEPAGGTPKPAVNEKAADLARVQEIKRNLERFEKLPPDENALIVD